MPGLAAGSVGASVPPGAGVPAGAGTAAAAGGSCVTNVWTSGGYALTGSFSRCARYDPISWNSGAALVPPCGASNMIATT